MSRRAAWICGAAVCAALLIGVAVWLGIASASTPATSPAPTPNASTTTPPPAAQQAQAELDALLGSCAESVAAVPPEHCGISIPWGTEFSAVTGIRYRIETLPVLRLDGDGFIADGGVLVATVTGTAQDGSPRTETYRTENWAVRGDITKSDGSVELTVW